MDSERQRPTRRRRRQRRRGGRQRRFHMVAAIVFAMLFTGIMTAVFWFGEGGDSTTIGASN